jgi:hypothetical protein
MIPLALGNIFVTAIFILVGQEQAMAWIGVAAIGATIFYMTRKPERVTKAPAAPGKVAHAR